MKGIEYDHCEKCDEAGSGGMVRAFEADGNEPFFGKACEKIQGEERYQHYEGVDVSAVDIAPESHYGNNKPDVQYVSVGCKDEYKQEGCYKQIRETCGSDVKKGTSDEHCKACENR